MTSQNDDEKQNQNVTS